MRFRYTLYLNGSVFGVGSYSYIQQLIRDYVENSDMYGRNKAVFKIERRGSLSE